MTVDEGQPQSPTQALDPAEKRRLGRRVYAASFIGTTVELFDFILYGLSAAIVFPAVFFAGTSPAVGTVFSFATLAVGYAARPLGGLIAGHFGDKYGRKVVLIWTMSMMGAATCLVGLLPGSASIGNWAPILLITLRVIQGLAAGGEWGGAILMSVEHASEGKRGLFSSAAVVGGGAGVFLAYLAFDLLGFLSDDQFMSFGWRIPFVASILLIAVGLFVRLRVSESPVFLEESEQRREVRGWRQLPLFELFRAEPARACAAILIYAGPFMAQALLSTYVITWAITKFGFARQTFLGALIPALAIMVVALFFYGWLSDKVGRRIIYIPAAIAWAVFYVFVFPMAETGDPLTLFFLFLIGMAILNGATNGVVGAILSEIFPTRYRYTGSSVAYQFSGLIGGGLGPLFAALFIGWGWDTTSIVIMVGVTCLVSAIVCATFGDTRKRDIRA
ncbi:MFS transporter [Pseudonocardia sulfidoxydans NBRC 16205]|uniref:MFS transporter n=1 Tax=Pseudonocardia sulfidoxydans NBRC 16205 TaxID=1223511 RepID=A0A511DC71_9PSEU|nr:MFS transporter [Pseudonocardia sulfidoxydans]GEL22400.1 MFS transporter [Pseudonocardia sulfidoxydans NBRC 16205]